VNTRNKRRELFSVVSCELVAKQRRGKHISEADNQHATIKETVFSLGVAPRLYDQNLRQTDRIEIVSGFGS
jgi:hypothetical protein